MYRQEADLEFATAALQHSFVNFSFNLLEMAFLWALTGGGALPAYNIQGQHSLSCFTSHFDSTSSSLKQCDLLLVPAIDRFQQVELESQLFQQARTVETKNVR